MIRFLFRLLSMVALAAAVIFAVLDATRSVAANMLVTTPFGESWLAGLPSSLEAVQSVIVTSLGQAAWDAIVLYILTWPGFAVFGVLAVLFYVLGHRRPRRADPFAQRA